jgi:23S rRNA (guanine745-N1)-methyltransferase
MEDPIACPNCMEPLSKEEQVWTCANKHAFDVSKEGYLNLLLPNKKKSNDPGDTKQMIRSREDFLSTGTFDFLIDRLKTEIVTLYKESITEDKQGLALDLGCGSGYYNRHLFESPLFQRIGIDISKNAASIAARIDKESLYLVGSVFSVPVLDQTVDMLLNIFSPLELKEAHRLLKEGGHLIKVVPGKKHMVEISEMIYEKVIEHSSDFEKKVNSFEGLSIHSQFQLEQKVTICSENLLSWISMTPFFYKFEKAELSKLKGQDVTLSFGVYIVRKEVHASSDSPPPHTI